MIVFLLSLHVLTAVIWVGGMLFALFFLQPAAAKLEREERVDLWCGILARFFSWIWGFTFITPLSGYALLFTRYDGPEHAGRHIAIMEHLGWTMILLFLFTFFAYYKKMARMASMRLIPEAGLYLNRIRIMVTINLMLGIGTILTAVTGRFW